MSESTRLRRVLSFEAAARHHSDKAIFRLVHTTNYQGLYVRAGGWESHVPFETIWTQATWGSLCCPGLSRHVALDKSHFTESTDLYPSSMDWMLYCVSCTTSPTCNDYIFKLVLAPESAVSDFAEEHWTVIGALRPGHILSDVAGRLSFLRKQLRRQYSSVHFHIGLVGVPAIRTPLDTEQAIDEYADEFEQELDIHKWMEQAPYDQKAEEELSQLADMEDYFLEFPQLVEDGNWGELSKKELDEALTMKTSQEWGMDIDEHKSF